MLGAFRLRHDEENEDAMLMNDFDEEHDLLNHPGDQSSIAQQALDRLDEYDSVVSTIEQQGTTARHEETDPSYNGMIETSDYNIDPQLLPQNDHAPAVATVDDQNGNMPSPVNGMPNGSPEHVKINGVSSSSTESPSMRHSSRQSKIPNRFSPQQEQQQHRPSHTPPPTSKGKGGQDHAASAKKKNPSTPGPKAAHDPTTPTRKDSKGQANPLSQPGSASKLDAKPLTREEEEEAKSLRLARELQELEFGLRRRSK
jgi:hypothetical protein